MLLEFSFWSCLIVLLVFVWKHFPFGEIFFYNTEDVSVFDLTFIFVLVWVRGAFIGSYIWLPREWHSLEVFGGVNWWRSGLLARSMFLGCSLKLEGPKPGPEALPFPAVCRLSCRTLDYLSSITSNCMPPCYPS